MLLSKDNENSRVRMRVSSEAHFSVLQRDAIETRYLVGGKIFVDIGHQYKTLLIRVATGQTICIIDIENHHLENNIEEQNNESLFILLSCHYSAHR